MLPSGGLKALQAGTHANNLEAPSSWKEHWTESQGLRTIPQYSEEYIKMKSVNSAL